MITLQNMLDKWMPQAVSAPAQAGDAAAHTSGKGGGRNQNETHVLLPVA
jgi:hypothetical protein